MKAFLILLFSFPFWNTFQETAVINRLQESAYQAYQNKDYRKAITEYEELINIHHCTDTKIYYNLGTAYFRILQYKQAEKYFKKIISRNEAPYNSYCYNNIGIIYYRAGQYDKAQGYFKQALTLFPGNQEARFNYEAVTLTIAQNNPFMSNAGHDKKSKQSQGSKQNHASPQQQGTPMKPNANSGNKGSSNSSQQKSGGEGKGKEDALTTKRLQQINMTPQHAEYLLELLRQREIQYVHQQKGQAGDEEPAYPNW